MFIITHIPRQLCSKAKPIRNFITPQPFTSELLEHYHRIVSKNYDFLLPTNPPCSDLYVHQSDTPSSILRKNAIHIFPEALPQHSIQEKYKAHVKRLRQDYEKSFTGCKLPAEVFHLDRRIRTEIRQRCRYIGQISGKYKHYNLFKSINDITREKTQEEYKKNGIQVPLLGKSKIYPQGPVWLPTTDTYLKLFQQYLTQNHKPPTSILDLGCGSGILSFILAKMYKPSKICAIDNNSNAVETCQVNAASLGAHNVEATQCDVTDFEGFQSKLMEKKWPQKFQLIVTNPPWLIANRNKYESVILDGVYDGKGKFLNSAFKIANKYLKDKNSKFVLIYSDLSQNLGIQSKPIEQLCKENNFLIVSKLEAQYPKAIEKESPLSTYKMKSKVQLYEIARA